LTKFMLLATGSNMRLLGSLIFYSLAALFALALLGLITSKEAPAIVIFAFVILLTVFLGAPLYERYIQARVKKALKIIESLINNVDEGELRFNRPIKFRPVVFNAVGRKIWMSYGPSYSLSRHIEPIGGYRIGSAYDFGMPSYGIAIDKDGVGIVKLPGLEFDEAGLRNIILLYIPNRPPFINPLKHSFNTPWGYITVEIFEGQGLSGNFAFSGRGKATIYLSVSEWLKFKLISVRNGEANFSVKLAPQDPMLIVAHKISSPIAIGKYLDKPFIAGDSLSYCLLVELRRGLVKKSIYKFVAKRAAGSNYE